MKDGLAYAEDGSLIGDYETYRSLWEVHGIRPEASPARAEDAVIGYREADGRWYGWSEKDIQGFKPGDVLPKDADFWEDPKSDDPWAWTVPRGFKVKTPADARYVAIAFAESVR